MRINNNVAAFNAYRNLAANGTSLSKSLEKLSSGLRINRAGDDAAGLVISQNLRAQVGGLSQATRNAQDGISVVQTAEGALNEVHNMLGRMRDLAVQAANTGANDTDARTAAQNEATELSSEIDRIAQTTKFGSVSLLDGKFGAAATGTGNFQVGSGTNANDQIALKINDMGTAAGDCSTVAAANLKFDTDANIKTAIDNIDTAIKNVSTQRGTLGAAQNRFESVISNLQVTTENLTASESRIRDTDYSSEMVKFTRSQILNQAATSMLGQANRLPQGVLSLLQG
jgi:flagellin